MKNRAHWLPTGVMVAPLHSTLHLPRKLEQAAGGSTGILSEPEPVFTPAAIEIPLMPEPPEDEAAVRVPLFWTKGQLLNVRNGGEHYVVTVLGEEFDPRYPERAMKFANSAQCQDFVSRWYQRETYDGRA